MTAMQPGLCSITFRALEAERVATLAAEVGLAGIEWGGDVHAPPGDVALASRLARLCSDLGLACPTYGSYVRCEDAAEDRFEAVLDTAQSLGARTVRVWAGRQGSKDADRDQEARVAGLLANYCALAEARGLQVGLEWHRNTLTDTCASALALMSATAHQALVSYWQRRDGQSASDAIADVSALGASLAHAHIFWWHDYNNRMALAEGAAFWRSLLPKLASPPGSAERWGFLEFVRGDDEASFREDAAALLALLDESAAPDAPQVEEVKTHKLGG